MYDPEPNDDKIWWLRPHCGPGTLNSNIICGFCGKKCKTCAEDNTKCIKTNNEQLCGGSGFWCHKCGIFYPQDTCGDTYDGEHKTFSGITTCIKDNYIYCGNCNTKLYKKIN